MRKVKRAVEEFVTYKYESKEEKYEHAGAMSVQGYTVYEVKDELTVVYVKGLVNL